MLLNIFNDNSSQNSFLLLSNPSMQNYLFLCAHNVTPSTILFIQCLQSTLQFLLFKVCDANAGVKCRRVSMKGTAQFERWINKTNFFYKLKECMWHWHMKQRQQFHLQQERWILHHWNNGWLYWAVIFERKLKDKSKQHIHNEWKCSKNAHLLWVAWIFASVIEIFFVHLFSFVCFIYFCFLHLRGILSFRCNYWQLSFCLFNLLTSVC